MRQLAADVDLVWKNAMTYNIDGSWIYQSASKLKVRPTPLLTLTAAPFPPPPAPPHTDRGRRPPQAFADAKFSPLLSASGGGGAEGEVTELTFEMKAQLNQNANLLSSKDLYGRMA